MGLKKIQHRLEELRQVEFDFNIVATGQGEFGVQHRIMRDDIIELLFVVDDRVVDNDGDTVVTSVERRTGLRLQKPPDICRIRRYN